MSLIAHVTRHLGAARVYPSSELDDLFTAKTSLRSALALSPERIGRTDLFCPHLPYAVSKMLPCRFFTVTLVRDPIDIALSALHMAMDSRARDETTTAEEFYESDAVPHQWLVAHYLSWYLGATSEELRSLADTDEISVPEDAVKALDAPKDVVVSEAALVECACRNLEQIDAVALTDDPADVYAAVGRCLGMPVPTSPTRLNPSGGALMSPSLRAKLASGLDADLEVFEYASD